jgi:hypothetical protein
VSIREVWRISPRRFSGWEGWLAPALPIESEGVEVEERGQATLPNLKISLTALLV